MTFPGLLFPNPADRPEEQHATPDFFGDLELDRIVTAVTADREEYDLKPFFDLPLHDADAILYRQEVMRDLETPSLFAAIETFAAGMRAMRGHLDQAGKLREPRQQERWHLEAAAAYCEAVTRLYQALSIAAPASRGLSAFREYLAGYAASTDFQALLAQTGRLTIALAAIRYGLLIDGLTVQAHPDQGEPDYSAEIEATFERFKHGAVKGYLFKFDQMEEMNQVEARILDLVAQLYPELFSELTGFCAARKEFQPGPHHLRSGEPVLHRLSGVYRPLQKGGAGFLLSPPRRHRQGGVWRRVLRPGPVGKASRRSDNPGHQRLPPPGGGADHRGLGHLHR